MRIPSFLAKSILSFLIPASVLQPLYGFYDESNLDNSCHESKKNSCSFCHPLDPNRRLSFDEILECLDQIEQGDMDSATNEEVAMIDVWLIILAQAGVIPGDVYAENLLEKSLRELNGQESDFEFWAYQDSHDTPIH